MLCWRRILLAFGISTTLLSNSRDICVIFSPRVIDYFFIGATTLLNKPPRLGSNHWSAECDAHSIQLRIPPLVGGFAKKKHSANPSLPRVLGRASVCATTAGWRYSANTDARAIRSVTLAACRLRRWCGPCEKPQQKGRTATLRFSRREEPVAAREAGLYPLRVAPRHSFNLSLRRKEQSKRVCNCTHRDSLVFTWHQVSWSQQPPPLCLRVFHPGAHPQLPLCRLQPVGLVFFLQWHRSWWWGVLGQPVDRRQRRRAAPAAAPGPAPAASAAEGRSCAAALPAAAGGHSHNLRPAHRRYEQGIPHLLRRWTRPHTWVELNIFSLSRLGFQRFECSILAGGQLFSLD